MNISNTFQEQGFVQGIPLLSKNSVVKLRRHVERAERDSQENEQLCSQLNHPLQKIFQSLARHPVIVRYVSQLIGPNILVRNGDVFIKGPKAVHIIRWHVDTPYDWSKTAKMVNCWIGLNPISPFHGGLQYIPESHKHTFKREPPNKNKLSLLEDQMKELDPKTAIPLVMPAGYMAFHSFRTVHNSLSNKSDIKRIGLVLRFMSAHTPQEFAEAGQGFLVQGSPKLWENQLRDYIPISWSVK